MSVQTVTALIKAENVSVRAGGVPILEQVSVEVAPGEVLGLIGPNGAGKSTFLAALAGDSALSGGQVLINGTDPHHSSPKTMARHRSVMLQDVSVAFSFLVRDVVEMAQRDTPNPELVDAALAATFTSHLADRDVTTLSGGERARVALARVLVQNTPVVLLDEPTAAMDIKHHEATLGLVRQLATTGKSVVVVLHDLNAAAAYCDRILCLAHGRVAAAGLVAEVFREEILSEVYGWPVRVIPGPEGVPQVVPARGIGGSAQAASSQLMSLIGGSLTESSPSPLALRQG